MDKLIKILSDLWIMLIDDTIPDYILGAITWVSWYIMLLILCTPIIVVFLVILFFSRRKGGMYD